MGPRRSKIRYFCYNWPWPFGEIAKVKVFTVNVIVVPQTFWNLEGECIHTLTRGGMYWHLHLWRPRDFPRPKICPEGRGTSWGPRDIPRADGMYNPIHPNSGSVKCTLTAIIHQSLRMYQKMYLNRSMLKSILPCYEERMTNNKCQLFALFACLFICRKR